MTPRFPLAAYVVGLLLGTAPGPVQVLLVSETTRGRVRRGFLALAGVAGTFAALGAVFAGGLSQVDFGEPFLRAIRIAGGIFLVWAGFDALRDAYRSTRALPERSPPRRGMHPAARGVLAVTLNPGVWLFLPTTASALFADAARSGGPGLAFLTLAGLVAGAATVDTASHPPRRTRGAPHRAVAHRARHRSRRGPARDRPGLPVDRGPRLTGAGPGVRPLSHRPGPRTDR